MKSIELTNNEIALIAGALMILSEVNYIYDTEEKRDARIEAISVILEKLKSK